MSALTSEVLFTAAEVSKATGILLWNLRRYEPEGFGSPGHWRMVRGQGTVVYTELGVTALAASIEQTMPAVAHCLRVALQQRKETPSRVMFAPIPKNGTPVRLPHAHA
jgi:hypothetical protein